MYAAQHAIEHPDQVAFIMASTGEAVSYREFEGRSNQLAHLLVEHGLQPLDHYSIFMENNNRYFESCAAGERSGLYYTCINSYLNADEMDKIIAGKGIDLSKTKKVRDWEQDDYLIKF